MPLTRNAHCTCGQLRAQAQGEPVVVSLCHCLECQRRTGSPFGLGAWFERGSVNILGEFKTFTRTVEGRKVSNHFCPQCGGVLAWEIDARPGRIAIAVGMFADPDFPPPHRSIYEARKHPWLTIAGDMEHSD